VFVARKEKRGNYYAEACWAVEEGKFKAVEIRMAHNFHNNIYVFSKTLV